MISKTTTNSLSDIRSDDYVVHVAFSSYNFSWFMELISKTIGRKD